MADVGFKLKQDLEYIDTNPLQTTGPLTTFGQFKVACLDARLLAQDQACDIVDAFAWCDRPGKRKQVAPVAVGVKQGRDTRFISLRERGPKLTEPLGGKGVIRCIERGNKGGLTKVHKSCLVMFCLIVKEYYICLPFSTCSLACGSVECSLCETCRGKNGFSNGEYSVECKVRGG